MTTPRHPPASAANVAAWRRRRQAQLVSTPPADDHEERAGGFQAAPTVCSPDLIPSTFPESQQTALTAMIDLSKAEAPPRTPSVGRSGAQRPVPPPSLRGQAASAAPAQPVPDIALWALIDRPRVPARPAEVRPSRLPVKEAEPSQQRRASRNHRLTLLRWPLLIAILSIQAVLSLRLVWSNTAFLDEAIYLSAGHAEIAHWLHGTPVPAYSTYFSGAPVIYPPIGAIAYTLGGLAAARILSLLFMLGTTSLLWSTTSRLFNMCAAICATTLFAVLGPTLQIGAFATCDAMALFLLAASVWCMVASRERDDSALLLVAGTALLVVANATKYSTMIFDPSVIALAGLTIAAKRGVKPAVARSGYVATGAIGLMSALLALGGPPYLAGVLYSTVARTAVDNPALPVLADVWRWVGLVCAIAVTGVILSALRRHDRVQVIILAVLAISGVLAPLSQIRTYTTAALSGHADFGAWFAAAAAGYALAQLPQLGRPKSLRLAMAGLGLIAVALPASIMGRSQAAEIFRESPNSARLTAELRSLTQTHPGHYLAEDYNVPSFYLENTISWQRWSGTWYLSYTPPGITRPLTGPAAYYAAISHHYFSLVILNFRDTGQIDDLLTNAMSLADYQLIATVPSSAGRYKIWAYDPIQPAESGYGER